MLRYKYNKISTSQADLEMTHSRPGSAGIFPKIKLLFYTNLIKSILNHI